MIEELSDDQIAALGPEVRPFERSGFLREVLEGEDIIFFDDVINASNGVVPIHARKVDPGAILSNQPPDKERYLWIIDRHGLKLILESTLNPHADRKVVCHTTITGGKPVLQGVNYGLEWMAECILTTGQAAMERIRYNNEQPSLPISNRLASTLCRSLQGLK